MAEENKANDSRIKLVAGRATSNINTFISEFPDITVFDVMEYMKFITVYGAKIIAGSSLKEGKHPNIRTVIRDICESLSRQWKLLYQPILSLQTTLIGTVLMQKRKNPN